jgi:hypothetical protein
MRGHDARVLLFAGHSVLVPSPIVLSPNAIIVCSL